jgi:hypothetical protein
VGTPGFVAPELSTGDPRAIGPWSDVFSLAAVIYFLLTGQEYFPVKTPAEALMMALDHKRRSILDAPWLSPELRVREQTCRAIDLALACATAGKIEGRPQRAEALAAMILPWLRVDSMRSALLVRRLEHLREDEDPTQMQRWRWSAVRSPGDPPAIRSVAWDGDGHAMAVTSRGLAFWNGSIWIDVDPAGLPEPGGIRFVRRAAAGQWLVGSDGGFATLSTEGVKEVRELDLASDTRFDQMSGDLDDLAVLVGQGASGPPTLYASSGRRWLKPLPVPEAASISSIARVEDARWLIAGRGADGHGFAALYAPLDWEVRRFASPDVRAFLACAGQVERGVGLAAGTGGAVVFRQGQNVSFEAIEGGHDISAAGVDAAGRAWAASAGHIWIRRARSGRKGAPPRWDALWEDASWEVPIVSLFADLGGVIAMTADGGVIEGRVMRVTVGPGE